MVTMRPEPAAGGVIELIAGEAAGRLDQWLARELGLSRAAVQRAIAAGRVTVNGAPADKSIAPAAGAVVCLEPEDTLPLQRQEPPVVTVLYADAHLALIDKPAGLPVYANAGQTGRATLADALLAQFPALATLAAPEPRRPGMVHRLDADTSGIMVIGLDADTVRALQRQFHQREPDKVYLALVHGHLPHERALIDAPIGRHPRDRTRQTVAREGGREARTAYRVVEEWPTASLLEVELLTGRTHQIRVHLASIGHPVVGDRTYGPRRSLPGAARQMLHAWRLRLTHPVTGAVLQGEAPLPDDMQQMIARLRG
jgi:23S rRNA pseudouridine1911/1915/1917 synthase